MVTIGGGDRHVYKYCDGNYYDDARIRNHDDDIMHPNVTGDWADGWQAGCPALLTCDLVPHSY